MLYRGYISALLKTAGVSLKFFAVPRLRPVVDFIGPRIRASFCYVVLAFLFLTALSWVLFYSPLSAQYLIDSSVVTHGDLTGDGYFDIFDLIRLEKIVLLNLPPEARELEAGDVDGDGKLTNFDLLVMNDALRNVNQGMDMFEAIKAAIEADLGKGGDNVETYLDLARFYRKEGLLNRAKSVLESIIEAMDLNHPLYDTINKILDEIENEEHQKLQENEDILDQELYQPDDDVSGKVSLRRKLMQLRGKLAELLKDQKFSAHYNSQRVKSRLSSVMDDMLRKIGKDEMVDPDDFIEFNSNVRNVLEDPENIVKSLDNEQREKISRIVEQSTSEMREAALKLQQNYQTQQTASQQGSGTPGRATGLDTEILDRRDWRRRRSFNQENRRIDRYIVANSPDVEPDTISLVAPLYTLTWDVSNVLGAKNAALEISKANRKFSNPRGTRVDEENTLYYTPSLGGVTGQRKGSAHELEGIGVYQYRVAALNAQGELISRFSDAVELVVVTNNVDIIARKPRITPRKVSLENPSYTFQWDVTNVEGAKDAAVEISKPDVSFSNPNGRERNRANTFFYNPSLGQLSGTFTSSVEGLAGPGRYLFRVIAVSPYGDFIGRWSDPDTLIVTASETQEEPEQLSPPEVPVVPAPPQIDTSATELKISWDVSNIEGASGITLEIIKSSKDSANAAEQGESVPQETVLTQQIDNPKGTWNITPNLIPSPGHYLLRIAAVDPSGKLLSSWSKSYPLVLNISQKNVTKLSNDSQDTQSQTSITGTSPAAQPQEQEEVPQGDKLEVVSNNTPLYEDRNPSSREIESMQKGEILIRISTNGLWHRVYCPAHGTYGWVLTFNVRAIQ